MVWTISFWWVVEFAGSRLRNRWFWRTGFVMCGSCAVDLGGGFWNGWFARFGILCRFARNECVGVSTLLWELMHVGCACGMLRLTAVGVCLWVVVLADRVLFIFSGYNFWRSNRSICRVSRLGIVIVDGLIFCQ